MTFLAKAEYFTTPGRQGLPLADVLRRRRPGADRPRRHRRLPGALTTGVRILREGELLGIYPEGTRSPDGRLYRGKTGVARMALEAGVPVIPVAMINTDKIQPTGGGSRSCVRGPASASASRWTSPATRAWPATGSSSGR